MSESANSPAAATAARRPAPPSRRRRRARRLGLGLLALAAGWLTLAIHPQPLFAYSAQRANIVLHARAPLPPEAGPMLEEVVRRVARSPLYDRARVHHVFLCDTPSLFALFALWDRKVGGLAQVLLTGNVFIRPSNVAQGTVIGPSGQAKKGERTLTYFIAHEVTHAMTGDHIGRWRYRRLAAFQQEGYADHVGFAHDVNLARDREALAHDAPEMDPRRSGLYARYELLVSYLFQRRGMTVEELLARPLDPRQIEHEILERDDL